MRRRSKGQVIMEFIILTIIVVCSFLVMKGYIQRGLSGRWKASVDDLVEQYDPRGVDSAIRTTLYTNSETVVSVVPNGDTGYYTMRTDYSLMNEAKTGNYMVVDK